MRLLPRTVWLPLAAVCLTGCAALPQPVLIGVDCAMPKECKDVEGNAVITIDAKGEANPPCTSFWSKYDVTWVGASGAEIKDLEIQFKVQDGIRNPARPTCSGPLCFLASSEIPPEPSPSEVLHCYSVALRTESGKTTVVDPKLIIKY